MPPKRVQGIHAKGHKDLQSDFGLITLNHILSLTLLNQIVKFFRKSLEPFTLFLRLSD